MTEIENNTVLFGNKVSDDTISNYYELKVEFDNNKFNQTITNNQLGIACVDRWRGLREKHIVMIKMVIKYIIAIVLESKPEEQATLETHYDFDQKDIMKEIDRKDIMKGLLLLKMSQPSAPSERLLYPNLATIGKRGSALGSPTASRNNEQYTND